MPEETTTNYALPFPTPSGQVELTPADMEELAVRLEEVVSARAQSGFQPGDIKGTMKSLPGQGWLLCDGRAVNRAEYSALFSVIGVVCGEGDGVSTFNLPDGRGRSLVGASETRREIGVGISKIGGKISNLGRRFGAETILLSGQQTGTPEHKHGLALPVLPANGSGVYNGGSRANNDLNLSSITTAQTGQPVTASGPDAQPALEGHSNMNPWFCGNYFIKT